MKIGILTYHRSVNEGAVLQAYCVNKILKTLYPDVEVEVIDYRPLKMEIREYKKLIHFRKLNINYSGIKKFINIRSFLKEKGVQFSERSCTTNNLHKARYFLERGKYDLVVVGSDTVWEVREEFKSNVPKAPNIYFLPKLHGVKKVAFAASSDPVNLEIDFLEIDKHKINEAVEDFDFISVRDQATYELFKKKVGVKSKIIKIVDPTLLVDFSELISNNKSEEIRKEKKINNIGLAIGDIDFHKKISNLLYRNKDTVIYNLLGKGGDRDINFVKRNIGEKLHLYQNLDVLITDRFHSSIFAFKLGNAPVIFIEDSDKWKFSNSKGRDLFKRLGFENYVIRNDSDGSVDIELIKEKLNNWEKEKHLIKQRINKLIEDDLDKLSSIRKLVE